jgi:protein Tex
VKLSLTMYLELMAEMRERAHEAAIQVFARNLKDLLLAAPAGARPTLGLDPGIRTGVKVAVVDATGKLLETATIYPVPAEERPARRGATLLRADRPARRRADRHRQRHRQPRDRAAGGRGAADPPRPRPTRVMVSAEAGASVYSASELGAAEFPDLDVSCAARCRSPGACRTRWPNW